jgi:diguanylate cyclase (GGDEF)-like protein/PAS domain S-box-containing protein
MGARPFRHPRERSGVEAFIPIVRSNGDDAGESRLQLDLSWLRSLGWSVEELLTGGLEALIHPDDGRRTLNELERATAPGGGTDEFVLRLRARDGSYRWFSWHIRTAPDGSVECRAEDVTPHSSDDDTPTAFAEEHFRAMADASPALMWFADAHGRFEFVNRAWLAFTGGALGEIVGTRWVDGAHPADSRRIEELLEIGPGPAKEFTAEYRRLAASGEARWIMDSVVPRLDSEGRLVGWLGTGMDIHERKALEAQLRHQADHDALTGLVNRRRFEAELDRRIEGARVHGQPGAVLLVDIDHFKRINDTLGHAQGDRVLTAVASALRDRVRASDLVARLGGDEFAIVLGRIPLEQVQRVAEDLLECVRVREPGTTISVGAACFDRFTATTMDDLLTSADRALYAAKAEGRDRAVMAPEATAVS